MDVLGDVIARDRRSESTALAVPAVERGYDYRRFCTSAWKAGNFLRHIGVRGGAGVAIADDPIPEPVLTFYGAAAVGAVVRFGPSAEVKSDVRALVVPAADIDAYAFGPETKGVVYDDPPADPSVSYFERDVWSENPTAPPDQVAPADPLLRADGDTYTHGEVLGAARRVIDRASIDGDSVVAVRGPFTDPTVVVAGLVAPIVAGAEITIGPNADGIVVGGPKPDVETVEIG
ncbi:long-chain fatty acid--CoA ligase [Natronomonas sp. F2-12]|jgi:hypothetical protein|uniref:Long-chain fatty acid--CoA ligase n=1 Tax=Natronomonas aquatica TaxID=2841590 RepID=A0A9R1CS33_9EURY|nr:long-chain fatty acid--CoA ligase [Natronomonas aquatica]MCQ4332885.1 long-chain fatty acid--CoA ligase [Natronomonas aquatica]